MNEPSTPAPPAEAAPSVEAAAPAEATSHAQDLHFDERYLSKAGFIVKKVVHRWTTREQLVQAGKKPYSEEAPQSLDHLDFVPQSMVGWYRPSELVKAGIEAVVSSLFGSYADKREVESVLTKEEWHDYTDYLNENGEVWVDYIADLGDGWDATYTMARLLAEKELSLTTPEPQAEATSPVNTQRGSILVMGGDEVYPTANREEYNNRTIQPYRYALPFTGFVETAPSLYLIPGNHDWYDGLDSFFKIFCHGNWVGGWKTHQRRSYFALKLDAKLWLWGIDIQLNANIDQPQLNYFKHIALEAMEEGSKIILCTAEPSWVYGDAKTTEEKNPMKRDKQKEEIYHNLGHLEKKVINPYNHEVLIGLAGDWHNYTRYESKAGDGHQRFVSGGGGAYLYPTHNMPTDLKLAKKFGERAYSRKKIFPDAKASKRLANWSLLFPVFRWNWPFTGFLGAFYLLLAWIVQSVSKVGAGAGNTLLDKFSVSLDLREFINIIAHSPESIVFLTILVAGLMAFSGYTRWPKKIVHGGLHGLAHITLFLGLIYLFAQVNLVLLDLPVDHALQAVLFGVEMLVFGGFLGGTVFGLYLWLSNRLLKVHDNEVLLCQSDPDYKNFLRFRIKDGNITIYPVGVKRVNRKRSWSLDTTRRHLAAWELQPDAKDGASWFEPKEGTIQDYAHLIENPITVPYADPTAAQSSAPEQTP